MTCDLVVLTTFRVYFQFTVLTSRWRGSIGRNTAVPLLALFVLLCAYGSPLAAQSQVTSVWPNGKAYFFRGSQYYRYDPKSDRVDQGPLPIAGHWPGFPPEFQQGIDAEVLWPNGKVYFFKGNQYLRYDIVGDGVDEGPLPIAGHWPGLWADGVDAGVVWPNGKAYFFKGSQYIRYDIATDKAETGPTSIQGTWPGLPPEFAAGVEEAVVWNNSKAYFFKGDDYIRYDIAADKTDDGYPQTIFGNWSGLMGKFSTDAIASQWSNWTSLGGGAAQLATAMNKDGRLEVFAVGTDKALYHNWQNAPGGPMSGWQSLGGGITQIATAATLPLPLRENLGIQPAFLALTNSRQSSITKRR